MNAISTRVLLGAIVLVSIGLSGCARTLNTQVDQNAPAVDPKFSLTSYVEEGELLALVVGTRPTMTRSKFNYLPFEVGVVNRGVPNLTLSLESFTLIDEDGNRYPAVGEIELNKSYEGSVNADTAIGSSGTFRLGEIEPILAGRFTTFRRKRGVLTPATGRADLSNQFLEQFTYAVNMVYFPRPEGAEVRGEIFELFMDAPELEDPVFVRFRVPKR
ncbi:hypothetical protein ABI59_21295 [Acidobacteria bacterium Mor1]|nr:hypothetical protein ABI59_21295 [Acidobacteria bacterium Mor1]